MVADLANGSKSDVSDSTEKAPSPTAPADDSSSSDSDDDHYRPWSFLWSDYSYRAPKQRTVKPPPASAKNMKSKESETMLERAKYIPVRLTLVWICTIPSSHFNRKNAKFYDFWRLPLMQIAIPIV